MIPTRGLGRNEILDSVIGALVCFGLGRSAGGFTPEPEPEPEPMPVTAVHVLDFPRTRGFNDAI